MYFSIIVISWMISASGNYNDREIHADSIQEITMIEKYMLIASRKLQ
jgi:hypothetical protein